MIFIAYYILIQEIFHSILNSMLNPKELHEPVASCFKHLFHRIISHLWSAVFIQNPFVIVTFCAGSKPASFLGDTAVRELPDKNSSYIFIIHIDI